MANGGPTPSDTLPYLGQAFSTAPHPPGAGASPSCPSKAGVMQAFTYISVLQCRLYYCLGVVKPTDRGVCHQR